MRSGVENINVKYANEKGIQVAFAPGRNGDPVADFAVGLLLSIDRSIVERELRNNDTNWRRDIGDFPQYHAVGLMTVGIIGFGCIGRKVADRLLPFGCKVVVYDPYVSADAIKEYGCTPVSLEELLKESDAVTLHMRLTESTKHILKAEHFAMMKPTAWLINTARAGLIDEQALIDAVTSHKIGGVALDVFDKEPLPADYPLIGLPDVILTPHIAGGTADGVELAVSAVIDDLVRFCKGESIVNVAKA